MEQRAAGDGDSGSSGSGSSSNSTGALVVIDMQNRFLNEYVKGITPLVVWAIESARARALPIILVLFSDALAPERDQVFPTPQEEDLIPAVKAALKGYDRLSVAKKGWEDGSVPVDEILSGAYPDVGHLYVCGIYTEACVEETVIGLAHSPAGYEQYVLGMACAPNADNHAIDHHWNALDSMWKANRTSILNHFPL
jgi:nicotinamidase-related amidase